MRYLKLFLEHSEVPSYFIDLDSVGYVLDPNTGFMYAKWKKGGYDHENPYEVDFDDTLLERFKFIMNIFLTNQIQQSGISIFLKK